MEHSLPADTVTAELIVVRQLPEIEERLRTVKDSVDKRVSDALSMVCTEETVQAVKAERAKLNQEFAILEDQRKAAKKAVLEPYEQFEKTYKECVSDAFRRADADLKKKIDDVESEMKRRCEDGLRDYFAELCAVHHLDWLTYERAGIKVDMASAKAKTPKKLREQLVSFVAGVAESVERISSLDDAGEIMVEYHRSLDAAGAICAVKERHQRIEEQKAAQESHKSDQEREIEMVLRVEAMDTPIRVLHPEESVEDATMCEYIASLVEKSNQKNPDDVFESFTFTVLNVKRSQLWKIREFLNMEGIQYE